MSYVRAKIFVLFFFYICISPSAMASNFLINLVTLTDLNGGGVEPNDTLELCVTVQCSGSGTCQGTTVNWINTQNSTTPSSATFTNIPTPLNMNSPEITDCTLITVNPGTIGQEIVIDLTGDGRCNGPGGDCTPMTTIQQNITPVTLSATTSEVIGDKVKVDWSTSSELFNVGYQLWGLDGHDQKWEKLHNWLVKSGSGNAAEPQSYTKTVKIPGSVKQLIAVGISSVDSDGSEHYYGPFDLGQSYGDLSQLEPIAWDHIRAEVDEAMAAKGYVKDRVNGYRQVSAASSSVATEQVFELTVRDSGMVRLRSSEFAGAGLDLSEIKQRDIAVLDHTGAPVVRYVLAKGSGRGLNKTLGTAGEVYFHAKAPTGSAAIYSEVSHYRVVIDPARALSAPVQKKQGVTSGFSSHYRERIVVEEDSHYTLSAQADDPWVERVMTAQPGAPVADSKLISLPSDVDQSQGVDLLIGVGRSSELTPINDANTGKPTPRTRDYGGGDRYE